MLLLQVEREREKAGGRVGGGKGERAGGRVGGGRKRGQEGEWEVEEREGKRESGSWEWEKEPILARRPVMSISDNGRTITMKLVTGMLP